MDQLDLDPADRVNIFDILDADGSGSLEVRELITGVLSVRGEARKSDTVAALLAVRAVQDTLRRMEAKLSGVESSCGAASAAHRESNGSPPALLLHANESFGFLDSSCSAASPPCRKGSGPPPTSL